MKVFLILFCLFIFSCAPIAVSTAFDGDYAGSYDGYDKGIMTFTITGGSISNGITQSTVVTSSTTIATTSFYKLSGSVDTTGILSLKATTSTSVNSGMTFTGMTTKEGYFSGSWNGLSTLDRVGGTFRGAKR